VFWLVHCDATVTGGPHFDIVAADQADEARLHGGQRLPVGWLLGLEAGRLCVDLPGKDRTENFLLLVL
jgi:hypothetical protein